MSTKCGMVYTPWRRKHNRWKCISNNQWRNRAMTLVQSAILFSQKLTIFLTQITKPRIHFYEKWLSCIITTKFYSVIKYIHANLIDNYATIIFRHFHDITEEKAPKWINWRSFSGGKYNYNKSQYALFHYQLL